MIKMLVINTSLAASYLILLILLDVIFVHVLNEKITVLNKLALFVFSMPFISLYLTYKIADIEIDTLMKIFMYLIIFLGMNVIAFLELLWVATHFHSMIGGKV